MEKPTPRPNPMYPGELTDKNIRAIFDGAGDFYVRQLRCGDHCLYLYAIDGLTSGGDISDYVVKPITEHLSADSVTALYQRALRGMVYNAVADACDDLDDVALKLVNGFCVVLFPGAGAIAFEAKTPEKRGTSAPSVENTVKGPKDAFVETSRTNTSLVRLLPLAGEFESAALRWAEYLRRIRKLKSIACLSPSLGLYILPNRRDTPGIRVSHDNASRNSGAFRAGDIRRCGTPDILMAWIDPRDSPIMSFG